MSDLEAALRAKLDQIESAARSEIPNPVTGYDRYSLPYKTFGMGIDHCIKSLRECLNEYPYSWHDLRKNPEDLPEECMLNLQNDSELNIKPIHLIRDYGGHREMETRQAGTGIPINTIAWKYVSIPARFQTQEKV